MEANVCCLLVESYLNYQLTSFIWENDNKSTYPAIQFLNNKSTYPAIFGSKYHTFQMFRTKKIIRGHSYNNAAKESEQRAAFVYSII